MAKLKTKEINGDQDGWMETWKTWSEWMLVGWIKNGWKRWMNSWMDGRTRLLGLLGIKKTCGNKILSSSFPFDPSFSVELRQESSKCFTPKEQYSYQLRNSNKHYIFSQYHQNHQYTYWSMFRLLCNNWVFSLDLQDSAFLLYILLSAGKNRIIVTDSGPDIWQFDVWVGSPWQRDSRLQPIASSAA